MKEYFGIGSSKNLEKILLKKKVKNIFMITGKKSYEFSGAKERLDPILKMYNVTYFSDFETNPKLNDVKEGVSLLKKKEYDILIAVGGGSVIDMGKLINIFASQKGNMADYVKKRKEFEHKGKPFIAIPTTAGSGSEATQFAVVYIHKTKYSVVSKYLLPDYSLTDPQFMMSLSPYITAATGMDALCQAIESYWNINSTKTSKAYAKKAIKLVVENIYDAVNKPSPKSRTCMAQAANLAGKAINITRTTAPHAISYPITAYFGIHHGHAAGLTLGKMFKYNSQVNDNDIADKRGVKYVKKTIDELCSLLKVHDAYSAEIKITSIMQSIGLKVNLRELGINDINLIVNNINIERLKNNPITITKQNLRKILESIS